MVQERRKLFAGSDERAFAICCRVGHPNLSRRVPLPPPGTFATRHISRAATLASAPRPLGHHKTRTGPLFHQFSRSQHFLLLSRHDWRQLSPERPSAVPLPAKSRAPLNRRRLPQPPQSEISSERPDPAARRRVSAAQATQRNRTLPEFS